MVAAGDIQEGQVLLQVPEALFMTANTALKSSLCGKLVKSAELPEWQVWHNMGAAPTARVQT